MRAFLRKYQLGEERSFGAFSRDREPSGMAGLKNFEVLKKNINPSSLIESECLLTLQMSSPLFHLTSYM